MSDTLILKWAWVYGSLTVEEFDSVNEAIRAAEWASDEGTESLDAIEVLTEGASRVIDRDSVEYRAEADRLYEADKAAAVKYPPIVALVRVERNGKEATMQWAYSVEQAEETASSLRPLLGDRVKVTPPR